MPKRNTNYLYKENDDPITVANQFGITPTQLLGANPGGTPFSTGQTINIPFQYNAPIGPQPMIGPQPPTMQQYGNAVASQFGGAAPVGYGPVWQNKLLAQGEPTPQEPFASRLGVPRGHMQPNFLYGPQTGVGNPGTPYMMGRGGGQTNVLPEGLNYQRQVPGAPVTAAAPNTAQGDFYGYERDSKTGRSVRVIKNAGSANFLNELRWDPQARRYVSIGRLLKQGKLDLKGNWRRTSRRQRQAQSQNRKQTPAQTQQDFTLSNSLITFGAGSG